jgi:hypothetical protein
MSVADRIAELAATFGAQHANVAWLLCDRHPADDVAFTVIATDGTASVSVSWRARARSPDRVSPQPVLDRSVRANASIRPARRRHRTDAGPP